MSYHTSIMLKVELFAGTMVDQAAIDLCELAGRVGVLVVADFNGVKLWARSGDNPRMLAAAYDIQIQRPAHLYRVAQARDMIQPPPSKEGGE